MFFFMFFYYFHLVCCSVKHKSVILEHYIIIFHNFHSTEIYFSNFDKYFHISHIFFFIIFIIICLSFPKKKNECIFMEYNNVHFKNWSCHWENILYYYVPILDIDQHKIIDMLQSYGWAVWLRIYWLAAKKKFMGGTCWDVSYTCVDWDTSVCRFIANNFQLLFFRAYFWKNSSILSFRLSVPYFFAIFQSSFFKFWTPIEDYLRTNSTAWICDPLPRSSFSGFFHNISSYLKKNLYLSTGNVEKKSSSMKNYY
jgi:hypothetical protein